MDHFDQFLNAGETDCWKILDLEPTHNLKAVRRAYAKRLRTFNPEDHPDQFIKIREAFEAITNTLESLPHFEVEPDPAFKAFPKDLWRNTEFSEAVIQNATEHLEAQILEALGGDDGSLVVEQLEKLIQNHAHPRLARAVVHRITMQQTIGGKVNQTVAGHLGWRWFFSNYEFSFPLLPESEDRSRFADILYLAMMAPIQAVVTEIESLIDQGKDEAMTKLVARTLDRPEFDPLEMRHHLRLVLIRVLAPKCHGFSKATFSQLDQVLNWSWVYDCPSEEDARLYQTIQRWMAQLDHPQPRFSLKRFKHRLKERYLVVRVFFRILDLIARVYKILLIGLKWFATGLALYTLVLFIIGLILEYF